MTTPRSTAPATPVLAVSCRILRSPSHESVTTDLSLFSVSSLASEALGRHQKLLSFKSIGEQRGASPNPEVKPTRPADIPEIIWFEDGHDLIRSCAVLSSALGIQKSFSTSDITQLPIPDVQDLQQNPLRPSVSELALNSIQRCGYLLDNPRLEHASRSCSTWVAVGELQSTSQLPSPHGGQTNVPSLNTASPPPFTAADLIRSVNKKVRQNYIKRRLLTTYRALERLSQSEFNLDRLEAAAAAASIANGPGPTELIVPVLSTSKPSSQSNVSSGKKKSSEICPELKKQITYSIANNLTMTDIERERGKPLSKYDRNMMIFNWLHSLDETSVVEDMP